MAHLDETKLELILQSFQQVEHSLADPKVTADSNKITELSQERARLEPVVAEIEKRKSLLKQLADVQTQLKAEKDPEFIQVLKEEYNNLENTLESCESDLQLKMLPRDPNSGKNVFVEIRAGTGGDEAALFARDLFRMYSRFLDKKGIKIEIMRSQEIGLNGFKEVVFLARGADAYNLLHLEGGAHRVQRVPETESQGRLHTSACTVAVIPEVEEHEMQINANDLRIDVYRSSGPGGQSVNTTDSAVRITHIPTGLVVSCQDEKSQHKNKAKAMRVLRARLNEKEQEENQQKAAAEKKAQIGSGDRSEKIRTYNYPQNRITDHRINYTMHSLDKAMEGDLDELIDAVLQAEREKLLAETG